MGLLSFLGSLLGLGGGPSRTIEVQKAPAASGLNIIYGERRVEPVTVFKVASKKNILANAVNYDHYAAPLSTKNEENRKKLDWLHRVDVWGQGPISGIQKFWVDGDVSSGARFRKRPYFQGASKFGINPQAAAPELVAGHSEWQASHNGHGVAYT